MMVMETRVMVVAETVVTRSIKVAALIVLLRLPVMYLIMLFVVKEVVNDSGDGDGGSVVVGNCGDGDIVGCKGDVFLF